MDITTAVFVARWNKEGSVAIVLKMASYLKSIGIVCKVESASDNIAPELGLERVEFSTAKPQLGSVCVVVGGDGTMLGAARTWGLAGWELIGVNLGRVGFLTDIDANSCIESIVKIVNKQYTKESRGAISVDIFDPVVARDTAAQKTGLSAVAVNDVVCKSSSSRLVEFSLLIDSEFVYSQWCDGLVIATATGSTAYSVAAGGPIIHPQSNVYSIVPLCPQNLSNRPLVVSDKSKIKILFSGSGVSCFADGVALQNLGVGGHLNISCHENEYNLIHPQGYNYYNGLRNKLNWNK